MPKKKDLVEIIKANPGCKAIIDNDDWVLRSSKGRTLASAGDDIVERGDGGYGSGHCYGGDILQALAEIVGVKIESV